MEILEVKLLDFWQLTFNFVISLVAITPILSTINIISETLQSSQIDLLTANKQIHVLIIELQRLRSEDAWLDAGPPREILGPRGRVILGPLQIE